MSGAIGIEQIKKLPSFIENRRKNAVHFTELFTDHKDFIVQSEIHESSWFGFSLIIKPDSSLNRENIIKNLISNNIDCRPIVTGDFTQNEVLKYFDYEIHDELKNAKHLHQNGFFVGNHHILIKNEINHLYNILRNI